MRALPTLLLAFAVPLAAQQPRPRPARPAAAAPVVGPSVEGITQVVLANGLNIGLRESLGLRREVISPCHSITIGFDMEPVGRAAFAFPALRLPHMPRMSSCDPKSR